MRYLNLIWNVYLFAPLMFYDSRGNLFDTHCLKYNFFCLIFDSSFPSVFDGRSGDRIPVGAKFSAPVQTGPGAHQASYTMGTGSLSRG
jgi:hypothetical protein